jgi:hypothetical protein
MIQAEFDGPSQAIPEDLLRQFHSAQHHAPGLSQGLLDPSELPGEETVRSSAFRPPWLGRTVLPRMAPMTVPPRAFEAKTPPLLPATAMTQLMRQELIGSGYPFSAIGRVFSGVGGDVSNWRNTWTMSGTGVLVGRKLLLTASHIAPWNRGPGDWWMHFVPAYRAGGAPFGTSFVEQFRGVRTGKDVSGRDVVICKLYQPIGNLTGWLGRWRWFNDDRYKDFPYTSVGYPGNMFNAERPIIEPFVAVEDLDSDGDGLEIETRPFTSNGWSGGPLYFWRNNEPLVVGVCSGREEDVSIWDFFTKTSSVFAGGRRLLDLVAYGEANWA